ncbi:MAG: relaxase domain-containing protein [Actinobacteria bacterium]|nr:relaxase domain-containing protein [Actinomycetota bacterium]
MITVRKIQVEVGDRRGALAAARYALEPSEGPEAYVRDGEDASSPQWGGTVWLGSEEGLRQLGLERGAAVELEDLTAALQGRHARSGEQVRKAGPSPARDALGNELLDENGRPYKKQIVNSYDLTFSVPKSVSVLWSQADGELRHELEQAIVDSANTSLEHVVRTRPVIGGKEVGQGFVASASLHVVARTADGDPAPAPQLHVHLDLVGVLDENGKLRTPDSGALYKHSAMREMGAVARGVLARRLEGMGFAVKARTGRGGRYFELAGVPTDLAERLSGRSRDVLAWVEGVQRRLGVRLDNRGAARGAEATRRDKAAGSRVEIQSWWDGLAQEYEFGAGSIRRMRGKPIPGRDPAPIQEEIRKAVLERLWEEGPTVSVGALQSIAYEYVPMGVDLGEANQVLREMVARRELVTLDDWLVTSGEIRGTEEYVWNVALQAAQRGEALPGWAVEQGVATAEAGLDGHRLDPEQRQAVGQLTAGSDWACLTGRPGTGKGPVLEAVAEAHRSAGWEVIACSLDNATAVRLGKQVNGKAMSFQMLDYRLRTGLRIDDRTLLLIDEASKAGLKDWEILARAFEHAGRVVAVGDVRQSGAIECPGMFDLILADDRIPTSTLKVVRRHRDPADKSKPHPWLARASAVEGSGEGKEAIRPGYHDALYAGDAAEAIAVLKEEGALNIHATHEEAMVALVEKWHDRRGEYNLDVRDTVLVVYGTNEDVDRVNALAQAKRIQAGEIGGPSVPAVDRSYRIYAGDVVMLRETAYRPPEAEHGGPRPERVENGTMGTVLAVDPQRQRVTVGFDTPNDGMREVTMDLGELRARWEEQEALRKRGEKAERIPSLRLSIAGHVFPLQGGTWWYTGSLWGDGRMRLEDVISGDARAQCVLDVHVDRESLGREGTDNQKLVRKAKGLKEIRHKLASVTHEETRGAGVSAPYSNLEPAPALPLVEQADFERPGARREFRDPLRHHRRLLGPDRVAALERRAGELAELVGALGEEELEIAAERAEESIARLDPPAAYESLRIERAKVPVGKKIDNGRELAAELWAEAEAIRRSPRQRRERRQLLEAAAAREVEADRYEAELAELRGRERELRERGLHLDTWLESEGEAIALASAAERELAARGRREAGPELDGAGLDPRPAPDLGLEAGI